MTPTATEIIDEIYDLLGMLKERAGLMDSAIKTEHGVDFLMTRKEAAGFIGRSERQFDRLRAKGRIIPEIVDGKLLFWRSELLKYKGVSFTGPDAKRRKWDL